jgi:hypothetical protein
VDGNVFTKSIAITDFDPGFRGWIKGNILRQVTDYCVRMQAVFGAHTQIIMNHHMGADHAVCTNLDMIVNNGIGFYNNTLSELCIRGDNGSGVYTWLRHDIFQVIGNSHSQGG